MKRTQTLGRIAGIAAPTLIAVFMALLLNCCNLLTDSDDPVVNSVSISPPTAMVARGSSQDFTAAVAVAGGAAQTVTWSLEEAHVTGTKIEEITLGGGGGGRLIVASAETAKTLTVKATSTVDTTKYGTATVTITTPGEETADKTALATAISAANTAKDSVVVDTTATNVSVGTKWVTQAEMTALTTAITAAETVNNNAYATQSAVNDAVTALTAATNTFTNAKQDGTNTSIVAADKTALNDAISAANTAKTGVVISADGNDIAPETKWVTDTVMNALNTAITAAEAVNIKANATQAEVDDATTALTTATNTFTNAKQDGTNTSIVAANKTALISAIDEATTAKTGVVTSADGNDQTPETKWVTDTVMNALNTAITVAEAVNIKANATQAEVDDATMVLNTAKTIFTTAIQTVATDKIALTNAISAANTAKDDVAVDTDAASVPVGIKWVTDTVMNALNTAIVSAETVKNNNAATQTAVNDAVTALNNATSAFNNAKQDGSKTETITDSGASVNFTGLPEDESPTLDEAENILSWKADTEITFTIPPNSFDTYTWDVDGKTVSGDTNTLTLHAQDFAKGTHMVTVKVTKAGNSYAKWAQFKIEE
jgi:hypothetical protein